MSSCIFVCLNHTKTEYTVSHIKTQFAKGKPRGPDFSKFSSLGNDFILGFHLHLYDELRLTDTIFQREGEVLILFSGEIFNLSELVAFLFDSFEDDPHSPPPPPNSIDIHKILLRIYLRYGFEYLTVLLKGIFSIVIVDQSSTLEKHKIYVARDPIGISPLYLAYSDNGFVAFASDKNMISELASHVHSFPPGTYSVYYSTPQSTSKEWKKAIKCKPYITLPTPIFNSTQYHSHQQWQMQLICNMVLEIEAQCPANTPVACFISGGLKSSIIAAILSKYLARMGKPPLLTFFFGVTDNPRDLDRVQEFASYIGSTHTNILFEPGQINLVSTRNIEHTLFHLASTFITQTTDVKVIFTGDGMDELIGDRIQTDEPFLFDMLVRREIMNFHQLTGMRIEHTMYANSLDVRIPFMSQNIIQFMLSMPMSIRIHKREMVKSAFIQCASSNPFMDSYLDTWSIYSISHSPVESAFPK